MKVLEDEADNDYEPFDINPDNLSAISEPISILAAKFESREVSKFAATGLHLLLKLHFM